MKRNKSPGPDGIIVEFYQEYWEYLKDHILDIYNYSYEVHKLSYTQYLALLILLYKKGLREDLTNWRPISLNNVDIKLLSKVLACRLKQVLPEIISTDQNGCIMGRLAAKNIRLVEDILDKCDEDEVILLIDNEKAFDRVEKEWLFSVLEAFDLGDYFINWIKIMYSGMKSAIVTNGFVSEYFEISRGIRQGDSLSALLYVIQVEPLAEYQRETSELTGISLSQNNDKRVIVSQFVDVMAVFLNNV